MIISQSVVKKTCFTGKIRNNAIQVLFAVYQVNKGINIPARGVPRSEPTPLKTSMNPNELLTFSKPRSFPSKIGRVTAVQAAHKRVNLKNRDKRSKFSRRHNQLVNLQNANPRRTEKNRRSSYETKKGQARISAPLTVSAKLLRMRTFTFQRLEW